jgi:hypothetical protein
MAGSTSFTSSVAAKSDGMVVRWRHIAHGMTMGGASGLKIVQFVMVARVKTSENKWSIRSKQVVGSIAVNPLLVQTITFHKE